MRQLQAFHRAVISGSQSSFVFEDQRSAGPFGYATREGNAHGIILADAFGGKRFSGTVCHAGETQAIVQFERAEIGVIKGGELDFGARG